jgi:hypothetical protein
VTRLRDPGSYREFYKGLRDRTQAAIYAYNTGLVHPGDA